MLDQRMGTGSFQKRVPLAPFSHRAELGQAGTRGVPVHQFDDAQTNGPSGYLSANAAQQLQILFFLDDRAGHRRGLRIAERPLVVLHRDQRTHFQKRADTRVRAGHALEHLLPFELEWRLDGMG